MYVMSEAIMCNVILLSRYSVGEIEGKGREGGHREGIARVGSAGVSWVVWLYLV